MKLPNLLSSNFTYNRQKKYQKQNQYYHEVNTNQELRMNVMHTRKGKKFPLMSIPQFFSIFHFR